MNLQDPRIILFHVLEIIDYQNHKDKFVFEFIDLIGKKAIAQCVKLLDRETNDKLQEELKAVEDIDKCVLILHKYIGKDLYGKQLELVSQKMFLDYINKIMPTLTAEKQEELRKYLGTLGKGDANLSN